MCLNCISEMNQAFAFKQKCERSEKTLRVYLEQATNTSDQSKATQTNQIFTIPLNKNYLHLEADEAGQSTQSHTSVVENSIDELDGNGLETEYHQQIADYPSAEHIENIQAEEQIESTLIDNDESRSTVAEVVEEFIAESTLKFFCNHCEATFCSSRSLNMHVNGRKCMQVSYECDVCHKKFVKKRYLIRHLQRMHRMMSETKCTNDSNVDGKRKYKCHLCSKGRDCY